MSLETRYVTLGDLAAGRAFQSIAPWWARRLSLVASRLFERGYLPSTKLNHVSAVALIKTKGVGAGTLEKLRDLCAAEGVKQFVERAPVNL